MARKTVITDYQGLWIDEESLEELIKKLPDTDKIAVYLTDPITKCTMYITLYLKDDIVHLTYVYGNATIFLPTQIIFMTFSEGQSSIDR